MSKPLNNSRGEIQYRDLADYVKRAGKRKQHVALVELEIDPPRLTELLNPHVYRPRVSAELVERIARLLNRPPEYVRKLYPRAA